MFGLDFRGRNVRDRKNFMISAGLQLSVVLARLLACGICRGVCFI